MMNQNDTLAALSALSDGRLKLNHPMAGHTTFQCGGQADYFCAPNSISMMQQLIAAAHQQQLPVFILGGGSNVVFRDHGFRGLVLSTVEIKHLQPLDHARLKIGAGVLNHTITQATYDHHFSGFEWAAGLPGSIGGALFMNARCYGSSIAALVSEISYIDQQGQLTTIPPAACQFDYKQSVFQHQPWVIIEVVLQFKPGNLEKIKQISQATIQDRINKHQFDYPSAGCVFKNDYHYGIPSGKLIEECGLKGRQIGDAKIFEHHANFIVNQGSAVTSDIESLMDLIRSEVNRHHGINLEPEIRIIG